MTNIFKVILLSAIIVLMTSCTMDESTKSRVIITGYYDKPSSLEDEGAMVLDGLSEGEFIEIVIQGEIKDFQHIRLEWDATTNDLIEKETINQFNQLKNQTMVIRTYMPEGIPSEKVKWSSINGNDYEFMIADLNSELEFELE